MSSEMGAEGDNALMPLLMLSPVMVPVVMVVPFMASMVPVLRNKNGKTAAGYEQQRPDHQ
jgi:hypothetical protein